jgi:alcohol dehydrogenase
VAAATGIDAIVHAVETSATNKRNDTSRRLSRQAWEMLDPSYERVMRDPADLEARRGMLMGAHLAGAAIENSMLGAAHSCANALTAVCGTVHGVAVGMILPSVIRFNSAADGNPYSDLMPDAERLAERIDRMLDAGELPHTLVEAGASEEQIPELAAVAARQWTATFNPRPVGEPEFRQIFQMAL